MIVREEMKIEYLLIKPNNDFCSNENQFKSLLLTNKRLSISEDCIKFSKVSFGFKLSSMKINHKKNKEIVFHFTVFTEDKHVKELEDLDVLIHRIISECGNQFNVNTIWDDISIYYSTMLYPKMILVENLLRELIYRFMIKTLGSAWFPNYMPKKVKDAIKNTAEKNNFEDVPVVDQLYFTDFIQLGWFFFEKYTTKPLNQNSIKDLAKIVHEKQDAEEKIKTFLETYEAKSNWERYFKNNLDVEDLYEKWQRLYKYRNCVAHAKRLRKGDYETATKLIDELKCAFEQCLESIDNVNMNQEEAEAVEEVAKETMNISHGSSPHTNFASSQHLGTLAGLDPFPTKTFEILTSNFPHGIGAGISQFANQQQQILNSVRTMADALGDSKQLTTGLQSLTGAIGSLTQTYQSSQGEDQSTRRMEEILNNVPDHVSKIRVDSPEFNNEHESKISINELVKQNIPKIITESDSKSESKEEEPQSNKRKE